MHPHDDAKAAQQPQQPAAPAPEPASAPTPRPARRWLKAAAYTGGALAALAVGAGTALWSWAGSEGSLATALGWAAKYQALTSQGVSGSLRTGGHIEQLQWEQGGLKVLARDVGLAWQPLALLHGRLQLDRLSAASIEAHDERAPSPQPAKAPTAIHLPLPVTLASFSVGQLDWQGKSSFSASALAGRYDFNGRQHQLALQSAQVAGGRYSAHANLAASAPLTLQATLSGALSVKLPKREAPVPLSLQASASGLLTDLALKAELQMAPTAEAEKIARPPQASATARLTPWAAQPLPQADANFRDLDIAALWPNLPQTLLTGSATVQPASNPAPGAAAAWALALQLANALPGSWDRQRLPLDRLDMQGEWRGGTALVRTLKARLGGGELLASGDWSAPPAAPASGGSSNPPTPSPGNPAASPPAPDWTLKATLKDINPALVHSQLGPLLLGGQAELRGQGASTQFEASIQAAGDAGSARPGPDTPPGQNQLLTQLRLRDASATGQWNPQPGGGTLALSALRVRTDEAELSGQLEVQPAAKGGQGKLAFTAPGLDAKLNGELRETSGNGELSLGARDAAQALRWLQKLPGMPAALHGASAKGGVQLQASWKGGWQDPALQARLDAPSLDWLPAPKAAPAPASKAVTPPASPDATATPPATPSMPAPASAGLLKLWELQATLSGRLSQAQLNTQGRLEMDQRRYGLQLALQGGRVKQNSASTLGASAWQGLLQQLSLSVQDPALGAGPWRLATRGAVPLKWTPTPAGGAFESGSGQASLIAPAAAPSQATLSWAPVRWRPGELITAGKLTGLPMAWIESLAGPQLAGTGLGGNLVFEGEWDAVLGNTLKLKASVARSSGDLTVQAEGLQGNVVRVAAGIRQARVWLDNAGDALSLGLRWDSERAGTAEGQLKTRLTHPPGTQGLGGWVWAPDAPLSGQLRAQLPRIGVWSLLAPPGWRLRGSLGADVAISGTRAAPSLAGTLQADDLALRSVVDGIEFGNGRLRASLDGTRMRISEFTLQGAGDKGTGGSLTAQGEAGWIAGQPQVQLDAKLQRLRASIRTDRQMTVSGDIKARLQGPQSELTGQLVVDQARFLLPDEGTPRLGSDVIVRNAGGDAAGQNAPFGNGAPTGEKKAGRPLKLAVELDLGRDLRVQGKGIDTLMRGTLTLSGTSLSEPRLTGSIRTSGGQYRAYGQRLDIERGVLRFSGPIDNPALNILAVRPNLTQRVGVQITGTALLPSVRLYAQPELPDAEKLSWLIVGRPSASGGAEAALLQQAALALLGSKTGGMSGGLASSLGLDELSFRANSSNADGSASGGAVTLGKRFSRNFYAAYERSLSGALGTLYVFYDISRRFTVRAQAGEQSAVDLIFTIPYD